jgi:hypothetical protein
MTGERLPEILAATIERKDGLPCTVCGGRHVESKHELEGGEHACICRCCGYGGLADLFEADFPDLIAVRGGVRIVTEAAMAEALRLMEAEIASLEKDAA